MWDGLENSTYWHPRILNCCPPGMSTWAGVYSWVEAMLEEGRR
jgi:hypothetical protein